jgi:uncharacterized protein (TIGR03545 family)
MFKWIRWSGLIGVLVFFGLIAAFFFFAAAPLVKSAIESAGTAAVGAKVEVADVDLSFAPLGFKLHGLQVTDPDKPMENLVEFDSAVAEVELGPLYLGKSIVRDLSIDGVRFGTERSESGALEKEQNSPASGSDDPGESIGSQLTEQLPSVDEILEREPLQTQAAGEAFVATYNERKSQLDASLANIPTEQDLKEYRDEVKDLTTRELTSLEDFKQRKQRLEQLKKQFAADKKAVNTAKDLIGATRIDVTQKLQELKAAPGQDMASIRSKYQLNETGATNLTRLLFGEDAAGWAAKALHWYGIISPYLNSGDDEPEEQRLEGRYVHFSTTDPWPSVLIRRASIRAETDAGDLAINATDLTNQQRVLGRPAVIEFDGAGLRAVDSLNAVLTLDHTTDSSKDTLTLDMVNWQIKEANLGIADTRLASAQTQLQAMAQVTEGEQLRSRLDAQFGNAQFDGSGNTLFAKELTSALQTINQFDIDVRANGDLTSPRVEMGSDLDKRLNKVFSQRLRQKQDELEARLQKRLNGLIDDYAGEYADELTALNDMDGSLTDRLSGLQDLGKAELKSFADQQKQKAKEKAKEAEAKAKKEAEAKAKAAEEKAKKAADAKANELKEDAKKALKSLF